MSYRCKFIRRLVVERRRPTLTTGWSLILECGHEIAAAHEIAAKKVLNPVCPTCNQIAADLGRAKRLVDDLPAKTK